MSLLELTETWMSSLKNGHRSEQQMPVLMSAELTG
jgi:hypothetical protein